MWSAALEEAARARCAPRGPSSRVRGTASHCAPNLSLSARMSRACLSHAACLLRHLGIGLQGGRCRRRPRAHRRRRSGRRRIFDDIWPQERLQVPRLLQDARRGHACMVRARLSSRAALHTLLRRTRRAHRCGVLLPCARARHDAFSGSTRRASPAARSRARSATSQSTATRRRPTRTRTRTRPRRS